MIFQNDPGCAVNRTAHHRTGENDSPSILRTSPDRVVPASEAAIVDIIGPVNLGIETFSGVLRVTVAAASDPGIGEAGGGVCSRGRLSAMPQGVAELSADVDTNIGGAAPCCPRPSRGMADGEMAMRVARNLGHAWEEHAARFDNLSMS
jgi:hypothetical protein